MVDPSGTSNHALQDHQMQLMFLEQQNKKRLIMMRQAHKAGPQLDPRVLPKGQNKPRHGLLTPPKTSPLEGQAYTSPSLYSPPTRVSNFPSCQQIIPYSPNEHITPLYQSNGFGYQEYQYPPNLQAKPISTTNVSDFHTSLSTDIVSRGSTALVLVPTSRYTNAFESPSNRSEESTDSMDSMISSETVDTMYSEVLTPGGHWDEPSDDALESTNSFLTNDTMDEVLTPWGQWDEPPTFGGAFGYETDCKAIESFDVSLGLLVAKSMDTTDQSLANCYKTAPPLPEGDFPGSLQGMEFNSIYTYSHSDISYADQSYNQVALIYGTSKSPIKKDLGPSGSSTCNINSLPSQAPTNRNMDAITHLHSLEQAGTHPKKGSRSEVLSNVLKGEDQGVNQSRSIANERGAKDRAYQTPVSKNSIATSKPNCDDDIRITIEVPSLPGAMTPSRNMTARQDLAESRRRTLSPSPFSGSSSETCPWSSDNETDWGDDEYDEGNKTIGAPIITEGRNMLTEQEFPNLVTKPVLSKMKQELVDRIMVEFWQIFNQEKGADTYEDTISRSTPMQQYEEQDINPQDGEGNAPTSKSSTTIDAQWNGNRPNNSQKGKRKRRGQDDEEKDEAENRNPKRPKGLLSPPRNQDDTSKFACPYRKHDAKKYCVRHWRSCALTPLDTVARVKGHLYRHHRIFPCQRCKTLFNDQQEVNNHVMEPKGCELLEVLQQDGITIEMVEKLRSKKKAHRDQSEEERWKEIYQILFPGEMVPSPFFEEVQEDSIQSPDSQELADYEEYCRRELPRVFRASLEESVNNNTQPLEEQLRSQLMDLIRDAQDRVFSTYRASSSIIIGTPTRGAPDSSPQSMTSSFSQGVSISPPRSQPTTRSLGDGSQARLPAFFQPPSPQTHLESGLDISDRNITPSKPDRNERSDSGYDSNSFGVAVGSSPGDSTVNTSLSSSQILPPSNTNPEPIGQGNNEVSRTAVKVASRAGPIKSDGNDLLDPDLGLPQHNFDFDSDSFNFSSFDVDDHDYSQNLDEFF